ncbi:MAG: MBL fold metallo-hydrolase [Phycisphaerae bacterium]|nr:MBL fold metallo-hydrolase [Phycisphaerae bacterium]
MPWSPTLLRCGSFRLDAGCMFGLIPRVVWTRWFPQGVIDDANRMPLQTNSLLLESTGRLVLVEVGIGDKMSPKEHQMYAQELTPAGRPRTILDALHEINARPEDISAVICTHLHFDHAGGLTRLGTDNDPARPVLTFPNAEIISQAREWDDALAGRSTMNKTYLPNHLNPEVRERIRLVEGEREVLPGITVIPVPGHTWGQQVIKIETPRGPVVFCNDVMPTALHAPPTTNHAYDVEPYTSILERAKLFARAASEKWTLVLDHEPNHPVHRVEAEAGKPDSLHLVQAGL